jgi:iron(III) transport system substrate-binding protein
VKRRTFLNFGASLSVMAGFASSTPRAAADGGEELLAAATKEGTLTWYAIDLPFNRAVVAAFSKRYPGIKLDAWLTGGLQVAQKFSTEKEAGREVADCLTAGVAEIFPEFRRKNNLALLSGLPNFSARANWTKDPNGSYFFYANYKVGLMYNRNLLRPEDVPKSYAELVQPQWRGKVAVVDPATGGFGLPLFRFIAAQPSLGFEWIRRLGENKPLFSFQAAQLAESVATGMRPVGLLRDTEAQGAKARGAPVEFVTAKEGFLLNMMPVAINSAAPHPNAAKLFVNWLLSDAAQLELEGQGVGIPVRSSDQAVRESGAWILDIESLTPSDTRSFLEKLDEELRR